MPKRRPTAEVHTRPQLHAVELGQIEVRVLACLERQAQEATELGTGRGVLLGRIVLDVLGTRRAPPSEFDTLKGVVDDMVNRQKIERSARGRHYITGTKPEPGEQSLDHQIRTAGISPLQSPRSHSVNRHTN